MTKKDNFDKFIDVMENLERKNPLLFNIVGTLLLMGSLYLLVYVFVLSIIG